MLSASLPVTLEPPQDGATPATAAAAPDDALVQRIAAVRGNEAATAALPRLEPDAGASWLPAPRSAVERGDETGIDVALAGFSAGTRFDDRHGQLLHA